jgi:hypothetical protein
MFTLFMVILLPLILRIFICNAIAALCLAHH